MALILDTNALSAFADGDPALRAVLETEADLAVPVIVVGEYLFGIRHSRHRQLYESWLRTHSRVFTLLPVSVDTAERYAEIRSELKAQGKPIPTNDLWIAACAREHGLGLASRDQHFRLVQDLRVIDW